MAEPDTPTELSQGDNNNFDNDFEKLDPFQMSGPGDHPHGEVGLDDQFDDMGLVTSSTEQDEDLYGATSQNEAGKPLATFEESLPGEAEPCADSPTFRNSFPLVDDSSDPSVPDSTALSKPTADSEPILDLGVSETNVSHPATTDRSSDIGLDLCQDTGTGNTAIAGFSASDISPKKKPKPFHGAGESWIKNIDPREQRNLQQICNPVLDLIYWRDVKKTGLVFGSVILLLLSLALFSVLSVVAYLFLAILTVTISFVLYKKVLGAVQKAGDGHPFKKYLEVEISLPEDRLHEVADLVLQHVTTTAKELRRLFLVEDLIDSMKFGLLLWVLTYIGAWFNGMSLIILVVVTIFTVPKFYETYKIQIDQYIDLVKTQVKNVLQQVQEKLPFPGKKKQA